MKRNRRKKLLLKVPSKMFFPLPLCNFLMFIYSRHECGGKAAEIPLKQLRYNKTFSVIVT